MPYRICLLFWLWTLSLSAQIVPDYAILREQLVARFRNLPAGKFESFGKGVKVSLDTRSRVIAFTFDACGGLRRGGYDAELIAYLRREKIPATLFLTSLWIDEHADIALELAQDTLFEIENHGQRHRPCSVSGASRYGVPGTANIGQAIDELELGARRIQLLNHRRPIYYRAATATSDGACSEIASALGMSIANFDILSGDAVAGTPQRVIADNITRQAHAGAVVIMHMNHPEWNGLEALQEVIPKLRKQGYSFVRLQDQPMREKRTGILAN